MGMFPKAKDGIFDVNDPVERLDVSILHNKIIAPVLGITNPRSDSRIDYVGGGKGLEELMSRVDSGDESRLLHVSYFHGGRITIADAGRMKPQPHGLNRTGRDFHSQYKITYKFLQK